MTTSPNNPAKVATSLSAPQEQRRLPSPAAIERLEVVDGFNSPRWVARMPSGPERTEIERFLRWLEDCRLMPGSKEYIVLRLSHLAGVHFPEVLKDQLTFGLRLRDMAKDLAGCSKLHLDWVLVEW